MTKGVLKPQLWTHRPVDETIAVYAEWAATYDAEITKRGYRTPDRLAAALSQSVTPETLVLDFGCGTGISGIALQNVGFRHLHGTDVTAEMLQKAAQSGIYERTWLPTAEDTGIVEGSYQAIVAVGVISLGAAPPDVLNTLLKCLPEGGILAFSYNEPTLNDSMYMNMLSHVLEQKHAEIVFRENGPHLEDVGMSSDVIVLKRL